MAPRQRCFALAAARLLPALFALMASSAPASRALASAPPPARDGPGFNVIVVGGSSGMGKAAAVAAVRRGGRALIAGRSEERLQRAAEEIRSYVSPEEDGDGAEDRVRTVVLDASDESEVERFAALLRGEGKDGESEWDGLVVSAAGPAPHGPVTSLETSKTRGLFDTKFWSAYHCAKHVSPLLRDGGSVAFVAGVLNRRPGINCAPLAATNGALEGLTRALALEFGPRLRVNCLSPGFCDTERFDRMDPDRKAAMLANTAESLPLGKVGRPEDMGEAIYYLLTAGFVTGTVLDVDGGHGVRQYANAANDPMRKTPQQSSATS
uniref:Uncharacterized protein n=1 Tax=Trieres chinensis TaxID=1514140 RepID=A0A7S1Z6C0_TRICV